MSTLKSTFQVKFWLVALAGAPFAFAVWKISELEWRYVLAISVAIVFVSIIMVGIHRVTDILIYALVFNIAFSMFGKWLFRASEGVRGIPAQGIHLGMAELLIVLAYTIWFAQIFIAKTEPLPKIQKIDFFILLLVVTQVFSLFGAVDKKYGFFAVVYNIKNILIYFFIAHKVKRRHLPLIVAIFMFTILFESSFALYERMTGNVGIAQTKGNIHDTGFGTQGKIPGIIEQIRTPGTTDDPHTLGLYFSMLLPVPFVLMMAHFLRPRTRVLIACILITGIMGLVVTFSRSGWLSFAISSAFALGVIVFSWKQTKALIIAIVIFVIASISYPRAYEYIFVRMLEAPYELLQGRFDINWTAFRLWRENFWFGYGVANYHNILDDPSITVIGYPGDLVHNMFLQIAAEMGLFGLISFFGIILVLMVQCWKLLKCKDLLIRALALAILTALIAYLLDGLTNPMFNAIVTYAQFWMYVALGTSFRRMLKEQAVTTSSELPLPLSE